jgi:hypothetical protein
MLHVPASAKGRRYSTGGAWHGMVKYMMALSMIQRAEAGISFIRRKDLQWRNKGEHRASFESIISRDYVRHMNGDKIIHASARKYLFSFPASCGTMMQVHRRVLQ